ncbi:terpene cyclase/mutase family protein [Nocardioides carbamazepini]|uniref:prenyltransferase/squalene oxidase repeat-containing protein n=1 Tax=Nocardioides carbamazepini TaxID=2854259 RepID=UPI002149BABB|nr:prenyltransferase/squalene oxidase repeat-containing protein [Nocardioides carbamazepini]MCR1782633.1 terpene cyclase/mutase family protein [Nocardioides carbamazepini]
MSTRSLVRRTVAAVAGGAVVAGGLMAVAPAPSAHAAPANAEAAAAAGWLADQLDETGVFSYLDPFSGTEVTDIGTTLDFGLSLLATDPDSDRVTAIAEAVGTHLEDYVGATYDATKSSAVAKAAAFYNEAGYDSMVVEGINLAERLEDSVDAEGRLGTSPNGDVYGQVWAVRTLFDLGSSKADEAAEYLIDDQRCGTAGWGYEFGGVCTSAVDGTAYVVHALLPQASLNPDAQFAVWDAVAWLKANQRADGGFGDWGVNNNGSTSEANGSGLAAWALGEAGETAEAEAAAAWVADHQLVDSPACGGAPAAGESGALGYDDQTIEDAIRFGIVPTDQQTWVIAGAQALAGLTYLPQRPGATGTVTGPTGYVHAGTSVKVDVAGLRPGLTSCLTGVGARQWLVGSSSATVLVPAGTGSHTLTLSYPGGSTTTTLKALDATKLKVKVAATLKAKKKATIKVKGLAAGESVTVTVGKKTATGTADAAGVAKVKVKVKKKGKAKVKVVGAFPDRKGKATTRVV